MSIPNQSFSEAIIRVWQQTPKKRCLQVDGQSMWPYFKKDDHIELHIEAINVHQLKPGDVIAFLRDNKIIVHRYIKKKRSGNQWKICERGDYLKSFRWIDATQVIGKATGIYRKGRRIDLRIRKQVLWNRYLGGLSWLWVCLLQLKIFLKKTFTQRSDHVR